MYSNLSMMVAQEHQRDLRRAAEAARLARSVAPARPSKRVAPRIQFAWRVRSSETAPRVISET
jgi:hypothetical protein